MQFVYSLEALSNLSYYGTEAKEIAWYGAPQKRLGSRAGYGEQWLTQPARTAEERTGWVF